MLEQFIASNHYELLKLLGQRIDPAEYSPEGLTHIKLQDLGHGVYKAHLDPKVYHSDDLFMEEVSCCTPMFAFISYQNGEIILGYRAPKIFGEFVREGSEWVLREYEDFTLPPQTPAEIRFEISKDYEALKKILS